jgi:hypothetical protein
VTPGPRRPGRGRPVTFDTAQRQRYLDAVTAGAKLSDAALTAGITPQWATRVAKDDLAFGTALATARELGRKARMEGMPHGESRYNHGRCRCTICTQAATTARTGRRHTTGADTGAPPGNSQPHSPDQPRLTVIHNPQAACDPRPLAAAS